MPDKVTGTKLLYIFIIILIVLLFIINSYANSEATQFQGMAESSETIINSESSVEIKKILVVEGQHVEKGEKLAELVNPELVLRISDINNQLLQLESEKGLDKVEINSKMLQTKIALQASLNEIGSKIKSIENQLRINKELSSGLKSFKLNKKDKSELKSPMVLEIEALEQEIKDKKREAGTTLTIYNEILKNGDTPIKLKIENLKDELQMLESKNNSLAIYAPFQGIIGNVYFRGGEKIAPFTPILSILQKRPSFVKGYIHESLYSEISLNDEVTVVSSDREKNIKGLIVGLGNRIVPYPVRLLKRPDFQLWGREITVKIPETNKLILGEKVFIYYKKNPMRNIAETIGKSIAENELNAIEVNKPVRIINQKGIEASGAVYDKEKDCFLVISDDTEKKKPVLFYINKIGNVNSEAEIKGLDKINDLESIVKFDENRIFILSSLNFSKKLNLKEERKILALIKRDNSYFVLEKKIDFLKLLQNIANIAPSPLNEFISKAINKKSLDIEGMTIKENTLLIAFKTPKYNEKPVILVIKNIEKIINEKPLDQNETEILTLENIPQNERVSDIYNDNGVLYITTSSKKEKSGSFYRIKNLKADLIRRFDNLKPEGIAKDKNSFFIFFDEGKELNSKFMELDI